MQGRIVVAWSLLAASLAFAQELPQSVEAKAITADGQTIACSIEFTIAFPDRVYRQGAASAVTGSINLWKANYVTSFKLVGADIDTGQPIPFPVATASLFGKPDGGAYASTRVDCENPHHYCAAIHDMAFLEVLEEALSSGSVRMAFNRKSGGMDIPLVLNVSQKVIFDAFECAEGLSR